MNAESLIPATAPTLSFSRRPAWLPLSQLVHILTARNRPSVPLAISVSGHGKVPVGGPLVAMKAAQ